MKQIVLLAPLGWLFPSESFPLETRSAGQSIIVSVNLFFTFVIVQSFLAMLCPFKYGIFLFFAGWVVVMSMFVSFFLPSDYHRQRLPYSHRLAMNKHIGRVYTGHTDCKQ
ncbi:hypothetical protein O6H91_07G003100 [Diphasiastrum complanatum]|uniref:Uncharacterized protein n=1 Tax=Diphasiastrum complanatum TaxID=34168 RepID=A0ACC2D231_DIPCM|nr:hypothetical protein O6H91_07G003100 [Diphasiastrum complanatum]